MPMILKSGDLLNTDVDEVSDENDIIKRILVPRQISDRVFLFHRNSCGIKILRAICGRPVLF